MITKHLGVVILFLGLACSAPSGDLVSHLPGLSSMTSFKQYSGYLTANERKHFHYWYEQLSVRYQL